MHAKCRHEHVCVPLLHGVSVALIRLCVGPRAGPGGIGCRKNASVLRLAMMMMTPPTTTCGKNFEPISCFVSVFVTSCRDEGSRKKSAAMPSGWQGWSK